MSRTRSGKDYSDSKDAGAVKAKAESKKPSDSKSTNYALLNSMQLKYQAAKEAALELDKAKTGGKVASVTGTIASKTSQAVGHVAKLPQSNTSNFDMSRAAFAYAAYVVARETILSSGTISYMLDVGATALFGVAALNQGGYLDSTKDAFSRAYNGSQASPTLYSGKGPDANPEMVKELEQKLDESTTPALN